jgi:hypothetical protein
MPLTCDAFPTRPFQRFMLLPGSLRQLVTGEDDRLLKQG